MRILILIYIVISALNPNFSFAEQSQPWQRFHDEKSELYGFRDLDHQVKITPKFIMVDAYEFNNIIAVIEQVGKEGYQSYYLLKNGKKIGIENLYMHGNYLDCECEGKIRFRDKRLDKVGFFDKNGQVVIPAVYSDAEPFRNNMAMVLMGAQRLCPDGEKYSFKKRNCEHFQWDGGRSYVINTKNEILINDFNHTRDIDWFSLEITEKEKDNPLRETFKGTNGEYYSFINFKKEFTQWLVSLFFPADDVDSLKANTFEKIIFWDDDKKLWSEVGKDLFFKKNSQAILKIIKGLKSSTLKFEIHNNPLGVRISSFANDLKSKYYDSCGNYKNWIHPLFDLVITHHSKKEGKKFLYQDIFKFLKTDNGYKLMEMSLRSAELK